MTARHSPAGAVLAGATAALPPVALDEVLDQAALQTRMDRKYLVPVDRFAGFVARLRDRFAVLEIDGRRLFRYESVYFDTADRRLYRQHLQGRRRRYKVRTRSYLDSGECAFEVKLKGSRSSTAKSRLPYALADRRAITGEARAFLDELVGTAYGVAPPALDPVLTTSYHRATLVDLDAGARLTCDVNLVCHGDDAVAPGPAETIIVESKSTSGNDVADRVLRELGIRPVSMSKYCVGVALLDPDIPANPWNRTLRREFAWQPGR